MPRITVDPLVKGNVVSHQHTDPLLVTNDAGTPSRIDAGDPGTKGLIVKGSFASNYPISGITSAYYKLDETSGATASDSAGSQDGTWAGTLGSQWGTGVINNGGVFNGSDNYIDLGAFSSLNGVSKAAFFFWMRAPGLNANKTMLARWNFQTQGQFAIQLDSSSATQIRVFVADQLIDAGTNYMESGNANLVANNWYHIAVSYDGTQASNINRIKIYKNATLCSNNALGTIPVTLSSPTAPLRIGQFQGLGREWLGEIDEVGIVVGNTISQADVTSLYNGGSGNTYGGSIQTANLMEYQDYQGNIKSSIGPDGRLNLLKLTTTQRNALTAASGTLIYNTTTAKVNVYTTAWEEITSA